jgi:hypothetical protein
MATNVMIEKKIATQEILVDAQMFSCNVRKIQ